MSTISEIHVVIGAGATGAATALRLAALGHRVKVVTRSGSGPAHSAIELIAADAADPSTLTMHTRGATSIYNCANPPYNKWTSDWPPLSASMLRAAEANNAVLVTLSNLYTYGETNPMRATDALAPPSIKGRVRADMWHEALEAHTAGRVRATEARASDFIGPGTGSNGHMGDRVIPRVIAGKSVSLLGRVDMPHSWTAISDVASTLVAIGSDERAWGRPWHVPTAAPLTQTELVHLMCDLAGVEPVKVKTMPSLILMLGALAMPVVREIKDVLYQFEQPFVIDSAETTNTFGLTATPIRDTLAAAIESYRPALAAAA